MTGRTLTFSPEAYAVLEYLAALEGTDVHTAVSRAIGLKREQAEAAACGWRVLLEKGGVVRELEMGEVAARSA